MAAVKQRYRIIVTSNTEYHVKDEVCAEVIDLRTGERRDGHAALGGRVMGTLRRNERGGVSWSSGFGLGDRVYLSTDVLTSPVRHIHEVDE